MSFQVTQCPSCESTFNTNPKLLEMANGRVRCGACLSVFDAIDNFVSSIESDQEQSDESVFIGNDPEDFFDPSVFLTRSALNQSDDELVITERDEASVGSDQSAFSDFISTEEIQSEDLFAREAPDSPPLPVEPSVEINEPALAQSEPPQPPDEEPGTNSEQEAVQLMEPDYDPGRIQGFESASEVALGHGADGAIEEAAEAINEESSDESLGAGESEEPEEHLEFFAAVDESLDGFAEPDALSDLEEIAQLEVTAVEPEDPLNDQDNAVDDLSADDQQNFVLADEESSDDADAIATNFKPTPRSLVDELTRLSGDTDKQPEEISLSISFPVKAAIQEDPTVDSTPGLVDSNEISSEPADTEAGTELRQLVARSINEEELAAAIEAGLQHFPAVSQPSDAAAEPSEEATEEVMADELGTEASAQSSESALTGDTAASSIDQSATETPDTLESDLDTSTEAIRARALQTQLEDENALEQIPREHLDALEKMATPVELVSGMSRSWGRRIGLFIVILLFSATLVAQYAWENQDRYSIDARFRPAFSFVCEQLGCELPEYAEIEAIRSNNLAVRSHPEREDGLMVTVEIRNTANFEQRFPVLILSFNNANNDTIALREFAPAEYLDAGLRDFEFMPVISPVQISIPIIDPGPDAVNYTLAFRSP